MLRFALQKMYCPVLLVLVTYSFSTQGFAFTNKISSSYHHQQEIKQQRTPTHPTTTVLFSGQKNDNDIFQTEKDDIATTREVKPQPVGIINRRQLFLQSAAAAAAATATAAWAKDEQYELVLPQSTLLADLATAPKRNIIITGANSGVGLAGAKLLTAAGHSVTLACRTQAKADKAAQLCNEYASTTTAVGAECNLASLASIRAFAASQKGKTIDTLVLNAGLAHGQNDNTVYRTEDGFEETIGVNHLGHFLLASLLAPSLSQKGAGGRLVITASPVHDPKSGGGDVGEPATVGVMNGFLQGKNFEMVDGASYNADKAYKDSKLCNILFMQEAARRYQNQFTVNAFSPGLIADPNGFFRYQNPKFATVFNKITKVTGVAETNEFGGAALSYLAVSPALEGQTGGWYDSVPPGKHQLARHLPSIEAQNIDEQRMLWKLSEQLVGV